MRVQHQPPHKLKFNGGSRKSIFPTFNVGAPMPSGTASPPQVAVQPTGGQNGTASATGHAGSGQPSPRPADQ